MNRVKEARTLMKRLMVPPGRKVRLKSHDPAWTGSIKDADTAKALLQREVQQLSRQQEMLYAQDTHSVLVIFQAMDAAGKDSAIRHVLTGVNPQGCQVFSFKAPSGEERDHTYLWRSMKALPERGRIGVHNRSHYEEVLVARVHKEILASQQLPQSLTGGGIWKRRFSEMCQFERHLADNGVVIVKFFLNVSKEEQRRRFLARIDEPEKNWKFSVSDVTERALWDQYMDAYQETFEHTSTWYAPWYIIPADHKWFTRLAVAAILVQTLDDLKLEFPAVSPAKRKELLEARRRLIAERG